MKSYHVLRLENMRAGEDHGQAASSRVGEEHGPAVARSGRVIQGGARAAVRSAGLSAGQRSMGGPYSGRGARTKKCYSG
jgi:hypothetical protein